VSLRDAELQDRHVQVGLPSDEQPVEIRERRVRALERDRLPEQHHLGVVGAGRHARPHRSDQASTRVVHALDELAAAFVVPLHRVAERLGQELLELGVVVEDRRRREPGFLGDVSQAQVEQAPRGDHAERGTTDLVAPQALVLLPRHDPPRRVP